VVVVNIGEDLPIAVAHDEASAIVFDGPRRRRRYLASDRSA
jgi:hypothetical protein